MKKSINASLKRVIKEFAKNDAARRDAIMEGNLKKEANCLRRSDEIVSKAPKCGNLSPSKRRKFEITKTRLSKTYGRKYGIKQKIK